MIRSLEVFLGIFILAYGAALFPLLPAFLNIVVLPSIWWVLGIFFSYLWKQQADKLLIGMTQCVWIYVTSKQLCSELICWIPSENRHGIPHWAASTARPWPNRTQCEMCIQSPEMVVMAEPLKVNVESLLVSILWEYECSMSWGSALLIDLRYIRCRSVKV